MSVVLCLVGGVVGAVAGAAVGMIIGEKKSTGEWYDITPVFWAGGCAIVGGIVGASLVGALI